MTCQRTIDDFLMRYVEGELTIGERLRFNLHLATCVHCRRYLDSYRKTMALGKAAAREAGPEQEVPEQLVKAILAATSQQKE
jgi:anti-sigma factor RsiW